MAYNARLLNRIKQEILKIQRKNQNIFLEKSIKNLTDYDHLPKHRRSMCKKYGGYTIVPSFIPNIRFHTQREDGENNTILWCLQTLCRSNSFFFFLTGTL